MDDRLERLAYALRDRYRIREEVGSGGMARVFLADDLKHGRPVALKVLRPELASTVGAERFLREVRIITSLNHPHIVPVHDSGEAEGHLYYVMPFMTGETLAERIRRDGALPPPEVATILREVAGALDYAHRLGVVHRDVKPSNVLLSDGHALLADFGIAKAVLDSPEGRVTATGLISGSVHYMSPEQASGSSDLDGRSDIYSLACVAHEMLTGTPPFEGSTQSVVVRHITESPPSLRSKLSSLPRSLDDAVAQGLEKEPERRPSTATAFVDGLEGFRRSPRRRPSRMAVLGVAGVIAVAALAVSSLGRGGGPADHAGLDPARIAVLYFDDLSPDRSLRYLADGLTEALIQELAAVQPLTVISRNGVKPYRDPVIGVDSLARILGTGHLVEGSVEAREGALTARVRLIDGSTGTEDVSEEIVVDGGDPLELRDRIVERAARFLGQELGRELALDETRGETRSADAWSLVQRAAALTDDADRLRWELGDGEAAERALLQADSLLAAAESIDSDWSEPVVRRGWVASQRARLRGSRGTRSEELLRLGEAHADRLLDRRPGDPSGLELRGALRNDLGWLNVVAADSSRAEDLRRRAESDLRAAVAADPGRAQAWVALADLMRVRGDFPEAAMAAEQAVAADPFLVHAEKEILFALTQVWLDLGQVERALAWSHEGRRRYPAEISFTAGELVIMAGWEGAPASADSAWALADDLAGWPPGRLLAAGVLARAGLADSARSVVRAVRDAGSDDPWLDYYEANARIQLGEPDRAVALLREYLSALPSRRSYIGSDWWWRPLRDRPDFQALVGAAPEGP